MIVESCTVIWFGLVWFGVARCGAVWVLAYRFTLEIVVFAHCELREIYENNMYTNITGYMYLLYIINCCHRINKNEIFVCFSERKLR